MPPASRPNINLRKGLGVIIYNGDIAQLGERDMRRFDSCYLHCSPTDGKSAYGKTAFCVARNLFELNEPLAQTDIQGVKYGG